MRAVAVFVLIASSWAPLAWGAPETATKQALPPTKAVTPLAPLTRPPPLAADVVVDVRPEVVVAENVRAAAVLYRAACLDEMKLFDVADRVASAFREGSLPLRSAGARAKLDAYVSGRNHRLSKEERAEMVAFVSDLVQPVFENAVVDMLAQMKTYAELVASVAQSVDEFTNDNVTPNAERDKLAEDSRKASHALALSMSNRGYGAAQLAASRLAAEMRNALALLADPEVQGAFGARSMHELVAKQAGISPADVARLERRADGGARLIVVLADNAPLLNDKSKARELARRLAREGSAARTWLADKPVRSAPAAAKKIQVLCFDAARRLVPGRGQRR